MNIHKKTKLTSYHQQEVWHLHYKEKITVTDLAKRFMVSLPTIYNVLKKARLKLFVLLTSKNERYKAINYGIKFLVKVEKFIEDKLRRQAKRYNKTYPGEMLHVDTKRLPLLKNETKQQTREYYSINIHLIFM